MKEFLRRILYLGRRKQFNADLDTEIQFHIETRAAELEKSGMPRAAARAQARREFGPSARMLEDTRSAWQIRWLEDLAGDVRYAARALRRNPAFAATAIGCLALGIGANTTIFSIGAEVAFSEPSVRQAENLAHVRMGGSSHISLGEFRNLQRVASFATLAGENEETQANWRDGENSSRLYVVRVTDNFFDMAGIPMATGRGIHTGETETVVLAYGFWQRRLGGDPNVVGRRLNLDGQSYLVVGVLPRDHRSVTGFGFAPDLYAPARDEKTVVAIYARLPEKMTRAEARERLKAVAAELDRTAPRGNRKWADNVQIGGIAGMDRIRFNRIMPLVFFFGMLMAIVGLVLLIACANVASLLLARASSRSHELAVRVSIGAGRGRLIRQLLAESLLLSGCGAALGLLLNISITAWLSTIQLPLPVPVQFVIQPDWRLLGYAAGVAILTSLVAGTMPAIKATRDAIYSALKREERRWSFRNVLVAGQLAVSVVLLSAGFLFIRSLLLATSTSPGFDIDHTIWAYMRLVPGSNSRAVIGAALERLRGLPGVESASIARVVPLNNNVTTGTMVKTDLSPDAIPVTFKHNSVGPDYFRTMQIPIVAGREFRDTDRPGGQAVGILNENLARKLFGDVNPVGHVIRFDESTVQIAGVARNSKYFSLSETDVLAYYEPYHRMETRNDLHFLIRAAGRPEPLIPAINAALSDVDLTASMETKPMTRALTFALLPSRFGAAVLGSMGLLGLALASIGLYGVLLYSVSRRTREIGLRMALGATPASVLKMVVAQSALLALAGISIGTAVAVFAVQPLAQFLVPGVKPGDPLNFLTAGAVFLLLTMAATTAPAVRALRVDPMVALRHE